MSDNFPSGMLHRPDDDPRQPEPYVVERGTLGCECCGYGGYWDVIDPEGVALGRSFGDKEEADELAGLMSDAYRLGQASCKETEP